MPKTTQKKKLSEVIEEYQQRIRGYVGESIKDALFNERKQSEAFCIKARISIASFYKYQQAGAVASSVIVDKMGKALGWNIIHIVGGDGRTTFEIEGYANLTLESRLIALAQADMPEEDKEKAIADIIKAKGKKTPEKIDRGSMADVMYTKARGRELGLIPCISHHYIDGGRAIKETTLTYQPEKLEESEFNGKSDKWFACIMGKAPKGSKIQSGSIVVFSSDKTTIDPKRGDRDIGDGDAVYMSADFPGGGFSLSSTSSRIGRVRSCRKDDFELLKEVGMWNKGLLRPEDYKFVPDAFKFKPTDFWIVDYNKKESGIGLHTIYIGEYQDLFFADAERYYYETEFGEKDILPCILDYNNISSTIYKAIGYKQNPYSNSNLDI